MKSPVTYIQPSIGIKLKIKITTNRKIKTMFLGVSPNKMSPDLFRVCSQYTHGIKPLKNHSMVEKGEEKTDREVHPN